MDFHILREPGRFLSPLLSFLLSRTGILIKMEREKENGRVGDIRGELRGDKSPSLRHRAHLARMFRVSGMFSDEI